MILHSSRFEFLYLFAVLLHETLQLLRRLEGNAEVRLIEAKLAEMVKLSKPVPQEQR